MTVGVLAIVGMTVGGMTVDGLTVGRMTVVGMTVDGLTVGGMTVGEMSCVLLSGAKKSRLVRSGASREREGSAAGLLKANVQTRCRTNHFLVFVFFPPTGFAPGQGRYYGEENGKRAPWDFERKGGNGPRGGGGGVERVAGLQNVIISGPYRRNSVLLWWKRLPSFKENLTIFWGERDEVCTYVRVALVCLASFLQEVLFEKGSRMTLSCLLRTTMFMACKITDIIHTRYMMFCARCCRDYMRRSARTVVRCDMMRFVSYRMSVDSPSISNTTYWRHSKQCVEPKHRYATSTFRRLLLSIWYMLHSRGSILVVLL